MKFYTMLATLIISLFFINTVEAQTFAANQKESLRGLNAMLLVVDFVQDALVIEEVNREQLELEIRRRMAANGIRNMSEAEWARSEGVPYLHVYLNTIRSEMGFFTYRIEVNLSQEIILKRNRSVSMMAPTWQTGTLGAIGVGRLADLRTEILHLVDIFLEDHKSVN